MVDPYFCNLIRISPNKNKNNITLFVMYLYLYEIQ
jgi:hypothetical protein